MKHIITIMLSLLFTQPISVYAITTMDNPVNFCINHFLELEGHVARWKQYVENAFQNTPDRVDLTHINIDEFSPEGSTTLTHVSIDDGIICNIERTGTIFRTYNGTEETSICIVIFVRVVLDSEK